MHIGKKILVIDDDSAILELIKTILQENNYNVRTSTDDSILKNLNEWGQPDLIILDVLLIDMDGRDITRKLKTQKSTKDIPIIMISANSNAHEGVFEAGADDFISKPFDIDHLLDVVEKNLNSSA